MCGEKETLTTKKCTAIEEPPPGPHIKRLWAQTAALCAEMESNHFIFQPLLIPTLVLRHLPLNKAESRMDLTFTHGPPQNKGHVSLICVQFREYAQSLRLEAVSRSGHAWETVYCECARLLLGRIHIVIHYCFQIT